MTETYSTYEAKAKLSEILRKVEDGRTVVISRHGKAIAEIRPIPERPMTLAQRLEQLATQGVLSVPSGTPESLRPLASRPGALERFLAERNR